MEYNLQKTLHSDYFDFDSSNAIDFEIEQYDEITPGIGQILQIDNIIVPIYHTSDLTTIVKDDSSEQLGAGGDISHLSTTENKDNESTQDNESTTDNETIIENSGNEQNSKKRKIIDDGIHSSFLHPKMFKTKTLSLPGTSNENQKNETKLTKKNETQVQQSKKSLKHKFNVY